MVLFPAPPQPSDDPGLKLPLSALAEPLSRAGHRDACCSLFVVVVVIVIPINKAIIDSVKEVLKGCKAKS